MAIFQLHQIDEMQKAIVKHCGNVLNQSAPQLTADEFITAFIDPNHATKLKETAELVYPGDARNTGNTAFKMQLKDNRSHLTGYISIGRSIPIMIPHYIQYGPSSWSGESAIYDRLMDWAEERYRIGCVLGDAIDALGMLNGVCGNAAAMNLVFPALTSVMAKAAGADEKHPLRRRADAIVKAKSFGELPALPREVIDRIKMAAATVQALFLVEYRTPLALEKNASVVLWGPMDADGHMQATTLARDSVYVGSVTTTFV